MACSRKSSFIYGSLLWWLFGCTTSSFKVIGQHQNATELRVTSDRVLLECEHQYDNDTKDSYGFLMHILDQEDTVLTIAQMNVLDRESCFRRIQKITRILKTTSAIYIGGAGDLNKAKIKGTRKYTFPNIGTFYDNGQSLQFLVIANEQGLCYDAYSGDEQPCPRKPFSIQDFK